MAIIPIVRPSWGSLLPGFLTDASTSGTASCVFTGAVVGMKVVQCTDLTGVVDATACFETQITVAGQIQQTVAFPGADRGVPVLLSY